jgi:hypothetical protein
MALAAKPMPTNGLGADAAVVERTPREMIITPIRIHKTRTARVEADLDSVVRTASPPNGWRRE